MKTEEKKIEKNDKYTMQNKPLVWLADENTEAKKERERP